MSHSDESLTNLAGNVPSGSHNQPSLVPAETQIGFVSEPFVELTSRLSRDSLPTASIKLPDPEELTVRLVNISQLQRLDELHSDVALLQTILFTSIGTVLGFITNVFTSNQQMDKSAWILLAILLASSVLFGALTIRASRRATELRRRLFDGSLQHTP